MQFNQSEENMNFQATDFYDHTIHLTLENSTLHL